MINNLLIAIRDGINQRPRTKSLVIKVINLVPGLKIKLKNALIIYGDNAKPSIEFQDLSPKAKLIYQALENAKREADCE